MNTLIVRHNVASIQKWVEELEERLTRVDTDLSELRAHELKFEIDALKFSDDLKNVVDSNKTIIQDDLKEIVSSVRKIVADLIGPLDERNYVLSGGLVDADNGL
jgi:hypothetical protein